MMFRRFRYKAEEGNWRRKWKQKVTDADGKVHFIDADPTEYHPGRGVYRSSARNAQRLARTEINMSYRTAEQERWRQFDFVVGYEVKTTQNGRHVEDICDCLAGKYRKDFKFLGWHPMCMCYSIPILKTEDEFFDDDDDAPSVNEVEDVPQGFKDWIKDNEERIERAEKRGTLPYFIRDNKTVVTNILEGGVGAKGNRRNDAEAARIEANRCEYERLKADPNYTDVEFNPKNGGLKATHIEHEKHTKVDKKRLAFGTMTPWDLEKECQEILYQNGYSCILNSEHLFDAATGKQLKVLDSTTNGMQMDIASITQNGKNAIRSAISKKRQQIKEINARNGEHNNTLILHFHEPAYYYEEKVRKQLGETFKRIIVVLNTKPNKVILIE